MAGATRQSARLSQNGNNSSPPSAKSTSGGTKRKAAGDDTTPTKAKRGRPSKEQKTIEETMPSNEDEEKIDDAEMEDVDEEGEDANDKTEDAADEGVEVGETKAEESTIEDAKAASMGEHPDSKDQDLTTEDVKKATNGDHKDKGEEPKANDSKQVQSTTEDDNAAGNRHDEKVDAKVDEENALDNVKADAGEAGTTTKEDDKEAHDEADTSNVAATAVEEDKQREQAQPSNILEKGIIYFFTRGRVGVEDPESVQDLQRSFFVLRPLPDGAKLTDGTIPDVGNNRLIALPKKVWPKSSKDKFMVFVEKGKTSMETLKEEFFQGSDYSTKTLGTRHTPEVTPIGEGVYAITSTGSGRPTSHLAYMLTIPKELDEVQKDVGLAEKGSFILSVKNPESSSPANAQLPATPEYPKEFIEEFKGRAWLPAEPKHLDYANASMLLIGEDFSGSLEATSKDEKDSTKETPQEELEKLENEDELRVEHLKGDDTIFADLGISSKDYPAVKTTW